jgi:hypothetical protein
MGKTSVISSKYSIHILFDANKFSSMYRTIIGFIFLKCFFYNGLKNVTKSKNGGNNR